VAHTTIDWKTFQEEIIQLVVPKSEREDIMREFHTLGYTGFDQSYMAISRVYFWYGMYKNLKIKYAHVLIVSETIGSATRVQPYISFGL